MAWHAVYNVSTGKLVSIGTVVADQLPEGLASQVLGESKPVGNWNAATHVFDAVVEETVMLPQDFMGLFTIAEETAIRNRAMTDANMVTFLARVERARTVTFSHPDTISGMDYCVAMGIITAERKTEILNG